MKAPPEHGRSRYTNMGCRCEICKTANKQFCNTYYLENKSEIRDKQNRKYKLLHPPVNKKRKTEDEIKAYRHLYYLKNKEKIIKRATENNRKNRNLSNTRIRNWKSKNPNKVLSYGHNRRAKILGNGGEHNEGDWLLLLNYFKFKCVKCGSEKQIQRDHVVPLSIGGTNDIENIQPLCSRCNLSKHDSAVDYRPSYPSFFYIEKSLANYFLAAKVLTFPEGNP